MAHEVSLADVHLQTSDTFDRFLQIVQEGTKEEAHNFLLGLIETAENASDSKNNHLKQLADALEENNASEVWKLIVKINEDGNNQTLENLNDICRIIAEKENDKENESHFKCSWDCKKLCKTFKNSLCYTLHWMKCDEGLEDLEGEAEMRSEKERRWIEILSNPLYISLEWLWRNNPNSQYKKGVRRNESKSADIIEAALDDACLLEKIASYEHYYSRDEYKRRAEEYETFAADIVEQVDTSDLNQLHEIMDIKGNGSLLQQTPANFNQSLSLLKLAADKQRKRVGIRFDGIVSHFTLHILRLNFPETRIVSRLPYILSLHPFASLVEAAWPSGLGRWI